MKPAIVSEERLPEGGRIARRFSELKLQGRSALITFITAGDPDPITSNQLLKGLPHSGADIIELAFPFSDPMADGPIIQEANQRAIQAGATLAGTLAMVKSFREQDANTPIVLMGYYNPVFAYGVQNFLRDAKNAGVDGLIVVDLPPEEDQEVCEPSKKVDINFIRLITPTTDTKRLPKLLKNSSGFLYYVSIAGITGTKPVELSHVHSAVSALRQNVTLPLAVGFGISTAEDARQIAKYADGVIIGSAIVNKIKENCDNMKQAKPGLVQNVLGYVKTLADAVHNHQGFT